MKIRKLNVLAMAGCIILILLGIWNIESMPRIMQCTVAAPTDVEALEELVTKRKSALSVMEDETRASCVTAYASVITIENTANSADIALYAGTDGMFAVYPEYVKEGRLPTDTELKNNVRVIALNESLAFKLFPTTSAVGSKVKIRDREYTVVGITYDDVTIVDRRPYAAYIPLESDEDVIYDTLTLSVLTQSDSGVDILFKGKAAASWTDDGNTYILTKEIMRALLPVRIVFSVIVLALLAALGRLIYNFIALRVKKLKTRLVSEYITALIPRICIYTLAAFAVVVAFGIVVYKYAEWLLIPLRVFPEWVPDDLSKWSSITAAIKQMAYSGAEAVQVRTREMCVIDYWHTIISYSTIAALVFALFAVKRNGTGHMFENTQVHGGRH